MIISTWMAHGVPRLNITFGSASEGVSWWDALLNQRPQKIILFNMDGFAGASAGEESACNAGDLSSIPGLGKSPGEGRDCLLQYSGLENSMDYIVHGVSKSWAWLRNFRFHSRECHKSIKTHACIQSVEGLDRTGSKGRRNLHPSSCFTAWTGQLTSPSPAFKLRLTALAHQFSDLQIQTKLYHQIPDSLACRHQTVGLPNLHNHMS